MSCLLSRLSYFEQTVRARPIWERVPSGYLLSSDAYREAAEGTGQRSVISAVARGDQGG